MVFGKSGGIQGTSMTKTPTNKQSSKTPKKENNTIKLQHNLSKINTVKY